MPNQTAYCSVHGAMAAADCPECAEAHGGNLEGEALTPTTSGPQDGALERGGTAAVQSEGKAREPSIRDLREQATLLGIPFKATDSKAALAARIAEKQAANGE